MKTRQIIAAIIISCGIMAITPVQAVAQTAPTRQTEQVRPGFINIDFINFQSGNVEMKVLVNGQQQYFQGTSAGTIGHFAVTGNTFEIEITNISWWTKPSFKYLSGTANLRVEKTAEYKYRVSGEDMAETGGVIVLVFGN